MDAKWHAQWAKVCGQLQSKIDLSERKGGSGGGGASNTKETETGAETGTETGAAEAPESTTSDALSYLFSRIGYDCGRVARGLHENRVSWGTYQDEMCRRDYGEFHCNAHSNNVVLLEEDAASGREAFLGYLDLDMVRYRIHFCFVGDGIDAPCRIGSAVWVAPVAVAIALRSL